jgi:hypothetical protein
MLLRARLENENGEQQEQEQDGAQRLPTVSTTLTRIWFPDEGHTLGNLLAQKLKTDSRMAFAGYQARTQETIGMELLVKLKQSEDVKDGQGDQGDQGDRPDVDMEDSDSESGPRAEQQRQQRQLTQKTLVVLKENCGDLADEFDSLAAQFTKQLRAFKSRC